MGHLLFYLLVSCSQIFVCIDGMLQEAAQAQQAQQLNTRTDFQPLLPLGYNGGPIGFNNGPIPIGFGGIVPIGYNGNSLPIGYNNGGGGQQILLNSLQQGQQTGFNSDVLRGSSSQQIGFNAGVQEGINSQQYEFNSGLQQAQVSQQLGLNSYGSQDQIAKVDLQGRTGIPYSRTDASGRPIYTISDLCRLLAQGILPGNVAVQPYGQYTGLEKVIQDAINGAQGRGRHSRKPKKTQPKEKDNAEGGPMDLGPFGPGSPNEPFGPGGPIRSNGAFGPNMAPLGPNGPFGPNGFNGPFGPLMPGGVQPFQSIIKPKVCTPISALLLPPMCPTGYILTSMPTVLGVKCVCVPMPIPVNTNLIGSASNNWNTGGSSSGQLTAQSIARSLDTNDKK